MSDKDLFKEYLSVDLTNKPKYYDYENDFTLEKCETYGKKEERNNDKIPDDKVLDKLNDIKYIHYIKEMYENCIKDLRKQVMEDYEKGIISQDTCTRIFVEIFKEKPIFKAEVEKKETSKKELGVKIEGHRINEIIEKDEK